MRAGQRVIAGGIIALALVARSPLAQAQEPGTAIVTPLEGGSKTEFAIRLPGRAECPGDSADDGYRVNSYMVPGHVAPESVTFDGLGPTPAAFGDRATFREPLFDVETNSYVSAQTADAELPGQPGQIINIPRFSFAVYKIGDLPPGRYHVGVACTLLNEIARIWDAEIVVTESAADEPAGIRWRVVGPPQSETSDGPVGLALGAVAVCLLGVVSVRRRRMSHPHTTRTEDP